MFQGNFLASGLKSRWLKAPVWPGSLWIRQFVPRRARPIVAIVAWFVMSSCQQTVRVQGPATACLYDPHYWYNMYTHSAGTNAKGAGVVQSTSEWKDKWKNKTNQNSNGNQPKSSACNNEKQGQKDPEKNEYKELTLIRHEAM